MRRLGAWLKRRYDWLMRDNVYIRSSDYNRTIMSGMAVAAGMFGAERAFPVHSVPKNIDRQLYEEIECPRAARELDGVWLSERAQRVRSNYSTMFAEVEKRLNETIASRDLWRVYDNFYCEKMNGVAWPSWLTNELFAQIEQAYHKLSQIEFSTDVLRRLRGGTLIAEIMERLARIAAGRFPTGLYAYSAHDATIAAVLSTLGRNYTTFPHYATALIIEMDEMSRVSVLFKNETDSEHLNIELESMMLHDMKQALQKYIPMDWEQECGFSNPDQPYILTIFLLLFTTCFFATLWILQRFGAKSTKRRTIYRFNGDDLTTLIDDNDD